MDEDHSRLRTRGIPSAGYTPRSPASLPRSLLPRGVGPPDAFYGDRGWSTDDPHLRRPSFVDARSSTSAGRGGYPTSDEGDPGSAGVEGEAGAAGETGARGGPVEMVCVDAVDLADIIAVRQEELAPEQVTVFSSDSFEFLRSSGRSSAPT